MPPMSNEKSQMEPLLTPTLCIRPFQKSDGSAFVEAARESILSVGVWLPWCHENYSLTEAESWFASCKQNLQAGSAYEFGIFSTSTRRLLGGIAINQLNRDHNFGNVGYWVRQSQHRKGIALQAVTAIVRYGFHELKLTRLEIAVAEENMASRRVAEKAGAVFECIARNRLVIRGKPHAAAVYSLVPEQSGL